MSLKEDYLRVKDRWKRKLGMSSANTSSTTVRQGGRSPSPMPRTIPRPQTPGDIANTTSDIKASQSDPLSMTSVAPTPTLNGSISDAVPKAEAPTPELVTSFISTSQEKPETSFERTKPMAWSRLKSLLLMLESGSEVFPPLKSAIGGLNKFIEIFETASQGRQEFEELITTLLSLLEDTGVYVNRAGPGMTNSVKNLWIGLDRELKIIEGMYQRDGIQRLVEALDDSEEIAKCHRRIRGHLERLALNANLSVWETVNESATETRLQRLSPALSAMYNSLDSEKVKRRECTPGTREKELEKLLRWARNKSPEAEDVYWMNGMAGTGKTTIACSLCAELEKSSELGASFFCSRLLPECRDVSLIIPCIAYQLARFSIPFCHELSNVLKEDPDVHARTLKTQFDKLLVKPLSKVKSALPSDFVIVIDALDECENEDSVGLILDALLSHATGKLPVRFLLSSRPESEIYDRMMSRVGHSLDARLVLHNVDADAVRQDIRTYLETELAAVGPTPVQVTALVDLSGVLFIFASTAARYITDGLKYMIHKKRLDMILGLSQTTPGSKGDGIDRLYASILKAVLENESIEEFLRTQLKTMLDTVICAQEPMNLDTIAGLLELESGKHVEVLLRRLSSVLNIAESTGLVTTLHASFPDYMLDHRRSTSFSCNPQTTHRQLSLACFEIMRAQDPQFNICGLDSSYLGDSQVLELRNRVNRAVSPHLLYACRYWMTHLELGEILDESQDRLRIFLSTQLLLWMEVLNLANYMHLGPGITRRVESWSRIRGYSTETIELAHDAWRFVTMFAGHAVSQSTPHIYASMLPFWPPSSPISKYYHSRMPGGIRPQGTAMTRRRLALLATWTFDDSVYAVCFSPDGSLIAVGASSSVYVIDSITGRAILGPLVHDGLMWTIAFSPDGALLATGSEDRKIRIWSTTDGKSVGEPIEAQMGRVHSLCFFPNGTWLASGGGDDTIRVWDINTGNTILGPIIGHTDAAISVSVSRDGTRIVSASPDRTIRVWDAQSGQMVVGPLEGHTARIDSVCFSPDGLRLASGSWDYTVRVWSNLPGPIAVELLQGHTDQVNSVVFSPDGKHIVSGSRDDSVRLWGGSTGFDCIAVFRGHMESVRSVAFSFDGARIVSGSYDHTVRVWDAQSRDAADSLLDGHTGIVESVSFSRDGRQILSCSHDRTLCIWDAPSGQLAVGPFRGHPNPINSACFSPDGTQIVSGSEDGTLRWWDADNASPVGDPATGHTGSIRSVCFSADGTLVASGATDNTIRLWDAQKHELVGSPLQMHENTVWSVCFSPEGSRLVSGSDDNTVMIWDVKTMNHALPPLRGHADGLGSVCVSPDGTRIASGSVDKTIRLWEAESGRALMNPLQGHRDTINTVGFSHDSRYIVSCSLDKSLRIWRAQTGESVGDPLLGHTENVWSCQISSCSRWVVSGSSDKNIRVWDIADMVDVPESKGVAWVSGNTFNPLISPATEISQHGAPSDGRASGPFESWKLQDDGWVVDSQKHLLAWVPPDLRHVLMSPRNTILISTDGSFQLGLDYSMLGDKWAISHTS